MRGKTIVRTFMFSAIIAVAADAAAQVLPDTAANRRRGVVGCYQSSSGIDCSNKYSSGGGGGGAYYQHQQFMNQMMMNTMQGLMNEFWAGYQRGLEQQRRRRAALNLNNAGIAYGKKGNWRAAVDHFRRALQYGNDPTIRKNLAWAEDELSGRAEARREAERQRRKRIAGMFDKLSDRLKKTPGNFDGAGQPPVADNGLEFLTPRGTAFFGEGGEAPPPVDARESVADENGLAFIDPTRRGGSLPAPPLVEGVPLGGGTQIAAAGEELQFISPDQVFRDAPASVDKPADPELRHDALSPKAALLLDALAQSGKDWDKSRAYLTDLQKRYPQDPNVRAAIEEHDKVRAIAERQAIDIKPVRNLRSEGEIKKAQKLIEDGNFLEARALLGDAHQRDPSNTELRDLYVGTHLVLTKEFEEYKEAARKAVRAGRYDEAQLHLGAAAKRAPHDTSVQTSLQAVNDFDPESYSLIDTMTADVSQEDQGRIEILRRQAQGLEQRGNYAEALDKTRDAFDLNVRDTSVWRERNRLMGMRNAELGKPDDWFVAGRLAVTPEADALLTRAEAAIKKGDYAGALEDIREAHLYHPKHRGLVDYIDYVSGLRDHAAEQKKPAGELDQRIRVGGNVARCIALVVELVAR